jgi:glycerol-3-phosphate dehydrogenase
VSRRFDLLIEGAGIQGATAACEAARRGLSVLLLDRADFGGGCSSNSMKIAHGGLRYLQSLNLPRSLESVRERRRLLQLAPVWVRPLPCRLAVEDRGALYRLAFRAGLLANDVLSQHRNRGVDATRHIPPARFPSWYDALIEDTERVLMAFIHAAREANPEGVQVRNYSHVEEYLERGGKVVAARIEGLGEVEVGCVVRCVGAGQPDARPILSMNLVVDRLPMSTHGSAVGLWHPDDARILFVVPWRDRSIVGTYDRDYPFDPSATLRLEPIWIDEILEWIAPVHPELAAIRRQDVRFVHAGLLPRDGSGESRPSERPTIECRSNGTVHVQGVKWTTAYGLSVKAVDRAVEALGRPSRHASTIPPQPLPDPRPRLENYLGEAPARREPVLPGRCPLTRGEVTLAVEHEWARGLDDVLLRRTGVAASGHPGAALVEAVASLLQPSLGWSDSQRRQCVEAFHADFHFAGNIPP